MDFLLSVCNLLVSVGDCVILMDVLFDLYFGQILLVIGESGFGKMVLVCVIVSWFFVFFVVMGGMISFCGCDLCVDLVYVCVLVGCEIVYVGGNFVGVLDLIMIVGV